MRKALDQRKLTTFKIRGNAPARSGLLALLALA
jgi:hypothetical protein